MIDLHVHSTASDGTLTPSEVCDAAIEAGLSAIALTDHDTIDGIPEILEYSKDKNIKIIPGTEISCYYKKTEIHILGLYADYKNPELLKILSDLKNARLERNLKMIELMRNDGIDITMEKLLHGEPDSVITRAHFARVLMEEGVCKTNDQAFRRYLGTGCKYYIPREKITIETAMDILTKYFGIAILAHPLIYKLGYKELDNLLEILKPLGLRGIECYHSSNNSYESMKLREIAKKHNLIISGGSDFHGGNKPDIKLGKGRGGLSIADSVLAEIESVVEGRFVQS